MVHIFYFIKFIKSLSFSFLCGMTLDLLCSALELFKEKQQLLYKFKDPAKKTVLKGADNEERLVFKIIEEAGNKGIWIRDIRFNSNLSAIQLNKVLKSLETKKNIKAIKSVSVRNLYIAFCIPY